MSWFALAIYSENLMHEMLVIKISIGDRKCFEIREFVIMRQLIIKRQIVRSCLNKWGKKFKIAQNLKQCMFEIVRLNRIMISIQKKTIQLFLYINLSTAVSAISCINHEINQQILIATIQFIKNSNRFNQSLIQRAKINIKNYTKPSVTFAILIYFISLWKYVFMLIVVLKQEGKVFVLVKSYLFFLLLLSVVSLSTV